LPAEEAMELLTVMNAERPLRIDFVNLALNHSRTERNMNCLVTEEV